jgi:hypothetical protein
MLNYVEIGSQYWFLRPTTFVSPKIIILTAESDNLVDEKSRKYYQSRKAFSLNLSVGKQSLASKNSSDSFAL